MRPETLIQVEGLKTHFFTDEGLVRAVDDVDFHIDNHKTLCIVGESGCGKSITARSILRLIEKPGKIIDGKILYQRSPGNIVDIASLDPRGEEIREIRGKEIAMIFQEPMSSLSPVHTIGNQIMEVITLHLDVTKREARERTLEVLRRVGIPNPDRVFNSYTFQLSGGLRQRAMIAMALACEPKLLIADEPTTALDVTTQANILDLIQELQQDYGMAVMFITHNLGVVAEIADEVAVMYLGTVVEQGDVETIFYHPKHPYTRALLQSMPMLGVGGKHRLASIRGMVPHPLERPQGCPFHPRCDHAIPGLCNRILPRRYELEEGHAVRCVLYEEAAVAD